jgi:hypothetical protein
MKEMKINIKKRNGMMSNIANTAVLRRRGRAGDEDSIAGTKTGVEVESIYRKDDGTSPFHVTKIYIVNINIVIHKKSIITTTIIMTLAEITILVVILMKLKKKSLQRMM